jgi:hypothetical protein
LQQHTCRPHDQKPEAPSLQGQSPASLLQRDDDLERHPEAA